MACQAGRVARNGGGMTIARTGRGMRDLGGKYAIDPSRPEMTARELTKALGGRWFGDYGIAPCPVPEHGKGRGDRNPSLSVRSGNNGGVVLVYCHAGCDQRQVMAALRDRGNCWVADCTCRRLGEANSRTEVIGVDRTKVALGLWRKSKPAPGTLVETYLGARGITLLPPNTLHFHGALAHPSGGTWPAMVALVTRGTDNLPLAVHRTFLARDGGGKAGVSPEKMMLGPCRGGAVRLAGADNGLMVGEGIETCLAAMQATGRPAWAALSTSGLRSLDLPEGVRELTVLADGDGSGESAAGKCARRWTMEGRRVRIAHPPRGMDFNDLLMCGLAGYEAAGT